MKQDHAKTKMFSTWNLHVASVILIFLFTWTCLVDYSEGKKTKKPKVVISNYDLRCDYKKLMHYNISDYTCAILYRKLQLKNPVPVTISGKHFWKCYDTNVTFLAFYGSTVKRIPNVIFEKFYNVERLDVQISKLEVLDKEDLRGAYSLKELWAKSNILEKLHADSFHGAPNLELISMSSNIIHTVDENTFKKVRNLEKLFLAKNYITTLHRDLFASLSKLKWIKLHSNKIQELPPGLFRNNLLLEDVSLNNNKIQMIADNLFTHLIILRHVNLTWNVCINQVFSDEYKEMAMLHQEICKCTEEDSLENRIAKLTKQLNDLKQTRRH